MYTTLSPWGSGYYVQGVHYFPQSSMQRERRVEKTSTSQGPNTTSNKTLPSLGGITAGHLPASICRQKQSLHIAWLRSSLASYHPRLSEYSSTSPVPMFQILMSLSRAPLMILVSSNCRQDTAAWWPWRVSLQSPAGKDHTYRTIASSRSV